MSLGPATRHHPHLATDKVIDEVEREIRSAALVPILAHRVPDHIDIDDDLAVLRLIPIDCADLLDDVIVEVRARRDKYGRIE